MAGGQAGRLKVKTVLITNFCVKFIPSNFIIILFSFFSWKIIISENYLPSVSINEINLKFQWQNRGVQKLF